MFEWLNKPYVSCKIASTKPEKKVLYYAGTWLQVKPEKYYRYDGTLSTQFGYPAMNTYVYIRLNKTVYDEHHWGGDTVGTQTIDIEDGKFVCSQYGGIHIYLLKQNYTTIGPSNYDLIAKLDCLINEDYKAMELAKQKEEQERISSFNSKLGEALKNTKCGDK